MEEQNDLILQKKTLCHQKDKENDENQIDKKMSAYEQNWTLSSGQSDARQLFQWIKWHSILNYKFPWRKQ